MCEHFVPKQASLLVLLEQTTPSHCPEQNMQQSSLSKNSDDESVAVSCMTPVEKTEFSDTGASPPLSPAVPSCSYRLRFDAANLVQAGDAHDDFKYVKYPAVDAETYPAAIACRQLTPEQAEAALQYLVSCGQRISQMTRAYDDVNCLTDLLQEKERDLELAAIIGKSLLESNRALQSRNDELESRIKQAEDAVAQLKHDLRGAKQLLALYTSHEDDENYDESGKFDADGADRSDSRRGSTAQKQTTLIKQLEADLLELRAENELLRSGAERLERSTDGFESQEICAVQQYVHDLAVANERLRQLDTEVDQRGDDVVRAQEDKQRLANTISELELKLKTCGTHLDELNQTLDLSYETEKYLVDEYEALQTKYEQVCECLQSLQEENQRRRRSGSLGAASITSSRRTINDIDDVEEEEDTETESSERNLKTSPRRRKSHGLHSGNDADDISESADDDAARTSKRRAARGKTKSASTAALSLATQLAMSSKENTATRADALRKMLETVRCARLSSNARHAWSHHGASSSTAPVNIADRILASGRRQPTTDSGTCSDLESPSAFNLLWNQQQQRMLTPPSSLYSEKSAAAAYCESRSSFMHPRRLAFLTESSAEEANDSLEHGIAGTAPLPAHSSSCSSSRSRSNNNNNLMQTEHHTHHHFGAGNKLNYIGQLEIVKPLESSLTLHQWSKLCMPRVADVLEERAGVHTKGANKSPLSRSVSTVTPSASGPDMTLLLATENSSSRIDAPKRNEGWSNSKHSDAGHALIEHLLANISSHNRMHRDSRLLMQHQQRSDAGMLSNRNGSVGESALGSSLESSMATQGTVSSPGIESASITPITDAETGLASETLPKTTSGVLTRAHLISNRTVAVAKPAVVETDEIFKPPLKSPVAVSGCTVAEKSPSAKSPFYREIIGAAVKQQQSSPLLRKGGTPMPAPAVNVDSNKKCDTVGRQPESTSETDSID